MSLVVVGLEQPLVPLDLLERVTVGDEDLAKVLGTLRDRSNLSEVVVLSTCLRTELYAVVERFHEGVADLQEYLADLAGTSLDALAQHVTVLFDDAVAVHLFEVSAGLRSAVLGESEVLGQVRRAVERAEHERAAGPVLSTLFRHAVKAGRRVRASTAISRGSTSMSQVAVEMAGARLGSLGAKRVVVVGAGEMAEGIVQALTGRDVEEVVVVNRTAARARALAAVAGGRGVALEALGEVLRSADALFVSTNATEKVVEAEQLVAARALLGADASPLVVVDLGVPRNVDPAVGSLEGVELLDIEDVSSCAQQAIDSRGAEHSAALEIVLREVERHKVDERARGAAPIVSAMRKRFDEVVRSELARHRTRLEALGERERSEVESLVRDVLAKLAHGPTEALKDAAGTPRGERLVEALRTLFDL